MSIQCNKIAVNVATARIGMDITLARTFLDIVSAGSFVAAAQRLHVTQTAVSARVRTLEEQVGARLFVRNKAGATSTSTHRPL